MEAVCFAKLWYSSAKLQHAVITWMIIIRNTVIRWCPPSRTSQRVGVQKDQWQYAYCVKCQGLNVLVFWIMTPGTLRVLVRQRTWYCTVWGMGAGEGDCNWCSTFENPVVRDQWKLRL